MVVPARGGSRGIPGKNVKPLAGRPLIQWVLLAGVAASMVDRIVVSTDDPEIEWAAHALGHDKIACFRRSAETATDSASTESALVEVAEAYPCRTLVLVQATSPLLTADALDGAIEKFQRQGADSLLSVVRQKRFFWAEDAQGWARPLNYDPANRPRRQEFDGTLVENGAVYVCARDRFLETQCRLFGRIAAYEMAPESYVELDDPSDWQVVEALLAARAGPQALDWSRIKIVLSDIDGVLTDAGMYYSERGDELKKFSTYDGQAVQLLREAGIPVGLITREDRALNARRAEKLNVAFIDQGARDKVATAERRLAEYGLGWSQAVYLGDDLHDVALMRKVGIALAPASAMAPARAAAHRVLDRAGGAGCLREVAEALMAGRGSSGSP